MTQMDETAKRSVLITGCSSGIEPLYSLSFVRHILDGEQLTEFNAHFLRRLTDEGLASEEILGGLARILKEHVQPKDVYGRFGGTLFAATFARPIRPTEGQTVDDIGTQLDSLAALYAMSIAFGLGAVAAYLIVRNIREGGMP